MTTRGPDDAKDLRDPRFDAAWRAHSREEPPAALDDAIRAAARREAHAGPRPVDAAAPHIASALRPQRWWWPLAAAATIGAVAIGLLQLAAPDRVGAPATDKGVVSDIPVVPEQARRRAEAAREELPSADGEQARERAQSSAMPRAPTPSAPRKDAAGPIARTERTPEPSTFAAEPPPAASASPEKPSSAAEKKTSRADASVPAPSAEPFPADAAKRDAKEAAPSTPAPSKTERATGAGVLSGELAGTPAPAVPADAQTRESAGAPATSAPAPRAKALGGATPQDRLAATPPPSAGSGAVTASPAQAAPSSPAERRASTRGASSDAQLTTSPAAQNAAARSELHAKQHPTLPVTEWIALIRRLRDEGKPEDAAKELAAFRAAYADHERLLPPDLRDWHPPAR